MRHLLTFAVAALVLAASSAARAAQPNLILFLADDLGWGDLACFGHPIIKTPNLDAFAMRVDDWKILVNAELTEFELYNLKTDAAEATDLKSAEPQRFAALREQLLKHNAAIDAEGPDWWKTLSPDGGKAKADGSAAKKAKKK
jgi:arylsulfatase A-like enzyme